MVQGPRSPLQTRILFHCAHKQNDESKLMQYHQQLTDSIEDQLSLASIHYQRSHFQVSDLENIVDRIPMLPSSLFSD
jgi:intraflagellar transport protein 56